MNKEIAKRICEQMTEDIDNLCNCPRKDEKIIDCYGCRELAIKTLLDYINQLETNRDELKKWLVYHKVRPTALSTIYAQMEYNFYEGVLNKMKELERGKK